MPDIRGRALYYPLILILGWVAARAAILSNSEIGDPARSPIVLLRQDRAADPVMLPVETINATPGEQPSRRTQSETLPTPPRKADSVKIVVAVPLAIGRPAPAVVKPLGQASEQNGAQTPITFLPLVRFSGFPAPATGGRLSGYGYSFWRQGSARSGTAPAGQYGGNQSGLQLSYDLGKGYDTGLALLARAAYAPNGNETEMALGLRWQRPVGLPISLTAERRVYPDRADRWAIYAAGGFDPQPLALGFTIDGYAQAGWVGGREATGFFDAQSRLVRPLAALGESRIKSGVGAWAGGEDGAQRFDIGPTLAADIPLGKSSVDLRIDWRQRIAGSARPGSGAALTIATGF